MALSNTAVLKYYGMFRDAVIRREILVCETVSLEMNRIDQLIDNPRYWYDDRAVEGFIHYCENELTLTDGSDLYLLDSFKLWAEQIFGWYYFIERSVFVPSETGSGGHYEMRRIKKRLTTKQYLIVARGAAKSMYASCLQNYELNVNTATTHQVTTAPTMPQSVKGIDAKDIQASAKAAKALVSLNDALPKSGGFLGALLGNSDLSNLGTQLKPFGEALSDYSNSVANVSPGKVANASTAVKSLVEAINATDSVKATGTSTFVQAVDTLAETNISGFVSAFKGSSSKVKNVGSTLTSALASGVKSKSNTLSTTASNMAESMKNSIASKDKEFQKVGVALISALAIGIQAQVNQAVNAANYVGASAANGSGQAYTSFYMNGINLGRGLVLGMNAMQQSAYNSGYALGQAAVRGEKDGQKSHSPSKLTIQAGKWLGEGLIIGMNAMESKTYGAGKSMGETAFDSIRSALSGMNDIIDSDMDTTPTIRPVLDLTNVKATAGKLNGLFTDPAFTPLANLRAIGNISARNNQNGNSDEVVRAINRLGKSLNNVGNTYNSINSVTYDNGSEISNAVETLVRAATVGRRR